MNRLSKIIFFSNSKQLILKYFATSCYNPELPIQFTVSVYENFEVRFHKKFSQILVNCLRRYIYIFNIL